MYCMRHIQNAGIFRTLPIIENSDMFRHIHILFRHIQPYCGIFRTLYNFCIFRTPPYSRYIQNSVKVYSGIFRMLSIAHILRTLPYRELCHIQNFSMFITRRLFNEFFYVRDLQCPEYMIQFLSVLQMIPKLPFFIVYISIVIWSLHIQQIALRI